MPAFSDANQKGLMPALLNKLISMYIRLKFGHIDRSLRYFYRDTYRCRIHQIRYFFNDYLLKRKKKVIQFSGEFAPELQFALPFAYWHYKNGTLLKTEAAAFTKELYFFSKNHHEVFDTRTNEGNYNLEVPRILYSHDYDMKKWLPVPLKEHYQNDIYVFEKPVLVIANRYNMEWGGPPISFYSKEMLDYIIHTLSWHYTILYNRPRPQHITNDNSDVYDLDEYDWLKQTHPHVVLMEDLYRENKGKASNYNHFQLMVYANADKFLSIHGGTATLASYFGGTNLIFSKQGPEHYFKCYERLYPQFSGAQILHAKTEEDIKNFIHKHFTPAAQQ